MYTAVFVVLCILHAVQYSTFLQKRATCLLACLLAAARFCFLHCGWGPANRSTTPPLGGPPGSPRLPSRVDRSPARHF